MPLKSISFSNGGAIYYSGEPYKSLSVGMIGTREDGTVWWKFDLPCYSSWKNYGEVKHRKSAQAAIRRVWKRWLKHANLYDVAPPESFSIVLPKNTRLV